MILNLRTDFLDCVAIICPDGNDKNQLITSFFTPQSIFVRQETSVMFIEISCTVAKVLVVKKVAKVLVVKVLFFGGGKLDFEEKHSFANTFIYGKVESFYLSN